MNKYGVGDLVAHRTRPYEKMVVVQVKSSPVDHTVKIYKCRWFNQLGMCFVTDEFLSQELEGITDGR